MGRQPRIEYAGAIYHLMCRGNRREVIFQNDGDRVVFIRTLEEVCERTGWEVCAYVLMDNHYHLVVQTPEANLVAGMKWFQGTYTKRHNARNQACGHLFQGRYKSMIIDPVASEYFRTACDYVHLNPARANLVGGKGQPAFRQYEWSSSRYLLCPSAETPSWLCLHRIVEEHTARKCDRRSRASYMQYLERRAAEEQTDSLIRMELYKGLQRGWCFGGSEFKADLKDGLVAYMECVGRDSIVGEPRCMHDEHEALKLLRGASKEVELDLKELGLIRKNDLRKEAISWLLSKRTAVTQEWVAQHLDMGSRANVSRAIHKFEKGEGEQTSLLKRRLEKMYRCMH